VLWEILSSDCEEALKMTAASIAANAAGADTARSLASLMKGAAKGGARRILERRLRDLEETQGDRDGTTP
jgi:hypothetical protein